MASGAEALRRGSRTDGGPFLRLHKDKKGGAWPGVDVDTAFGSAQVRACVAIWSLLLCRVRRLCRTRPMVDPVLRECIRYERGACWTDGQYLQFPVGSHSSIGGVALRQVWSARRDVLGIWYLSRLLCSSLCPPDGHRIAWSRDHRRQIGGRYGEGSRKNCGRREGVQVSSKTGIEEPDIRRGDARLADLYVLARACGKRRRKRCEETTACKRRHAHLLS